MAEREDMPVWRAKWIWADCPRIGSECYVYIRLEFELGRFSEAKAYVCASSAYKLYVNGRYVGRGPEIGLSESLTYDSYDLCRLLRQGRNAVGALCCWQAGSPLPPGFLMQIDFRGPDGTFAIATDATWRAKPAQD
ncbi:MAG: alpha-L-rhamnosidase N-terminal domain-containing protein, partial [Armatimonadota bacterium]|nr:alpha-L-rhamnosidase N-terminal domain-containing protein [Armatimonadota bacterium]